MKRTVEPCVTAVMRARQPDQKINDLLAIEQSILGSYIQTGQKGEGVQDRSRSIAGRGGEVVDDVADASRPRGDWRGCRGVQKRLAQSRYQFGQLPDHWDRGGTDVSNGCDGTEVGRRSRRHRDGENHALDSGQPGRLPDASQPGILTSCWINSPSDVGLAHQPFDGFLVIVGESETCPHGRHRAQIEEVLPSRARRRQTKDGCDGLGHRIDAILGWGSREPDLVGRVTDVRHGACGQQVRGILTSRTDDDDVPWLNRLVVGENCADDVADDFCLTVRPMAVVDLDGG